MIEGENNNYKPEIKERLLTERAWRSILVIKRFTIPDLLRTSAVQNNEDDYQRLETLLLNYEIHGIVKKIGSKAYEADGIYQQYDLVRNIGPHEPKSCDKCGQPISYQKCLRSKKDSGSEKELAQRMMPEFPKDDNEWIYGFGKYLIIYKFRKSCHAIGKLTMANLLNCPVIVIDDIYNGRINHDNKEVLENYLRHFCHDVFHFYVNKCPSLQDKNYSYYKNCDIDHFMDILYNEIKILMAVK